MAETARLKVKRWHVPEMSLNRKPPRRGELWERWRPELSILRAESHKTRRNVKIQSSHQIHSCVRYLVAVGGVYLLSWQDKKGVFHETGVLVSTSIN